MRQLRVASIFFLSASLAAHAQAKLQSLNLIQPNGKGRVIVPLSEDRKWKSFIFAGLPLLVMHDSATDFEIVYMLTPNNGTSSKDCLDEVMQHTEHGLATGASKASIKDEKKSEGKNVSGQPVSIGSFVITSGNNIKTPELYAYSIAATRDTCAELNIRKSEYASADDAPVQSALQEMNFDAGYTPVFTDYFLMATLINQLSQGRGYAGIAAYDQRALDTLPGDAPVTIRRIIVDRLSTSYDRIGQADKSRPINDAAIKADADYPMYYYNLARVDAEDFKVADAKAHLQQAWDRKANLPADQPMPDPTKDPSLQKLKTKSDFWTYVESLK